MMKRHLRKRLKYFAFSIVCSLFFCALGFFTIASAEGAKIVDRIVAVVNNDVILLSELNLSFEPYAAQIKLSGYPPERELKMLYAVRKDILNHLVNQKLINQETERSKITVSKREIDNTIERIKEAGLYTDEMLRRMLAREGLTMEEYRSRIREQILKTKLVNLKVKSRIIITKEDIKLYYESHSDKFKGEKKYHLRNIVINFPPHADEAARLTVFEKMEKILAKLEEGQPFEDMATIYSESPLAAKGGDLGLFRLDELSPQLQEAARGMEAGEFTSVLDTSQGYQILFVQEIVKAPRKTLEEVASEIEEKLFNETVDKKFWSWLENLRKGSYIRLKVEG